MEKATAITAVLEDYLEAIFNLCRFDQAARSRDIAETLSVHKSTVTAALKSLGQMRLINYAPYEAVTLTPEGRKVAEDVARRHAALKDFFTNVLKVETELAEKAACGMEHAVPREIVEKLALFAESMRDCPRLAVTAPTEHGVDDTCATCVESSSEGANCTMPTDPVTLDRIKPGRSAVITGVTGTGTVRKRLAEMGLVRGATVMVERIAPMGDPMDIIIKKYHLSLRKEEAARVLVQEEI